MVNLAFAVLGDPPRGSRPLPRAPGGGSRRTSTHATRRLHSAASMSRDDRGRPAPLVDGHFAPRERPYRGCLCERSTARPPGQSRPTATGTQRTETGVRQTRPVDPRPRRPRFRPGSLTRANLPQSRTRDWLRPARIRRRGGTGRFTSPSRRQHRQATRGVALRARRKSRRSGPCELELGCCGARVVTVDRVRPEHDGARCSFGPQSCRLGSDSGLDDAPEVAGSKI